MSIALIIFLILLYLWWKSRGNRKNIKLPPVCFSNLPILGSVHLFLFGDTKRALKIVNSLGEECIKLGGVGRISLGPLMYAGVANPDDAFTVLNTCLEKSKIYEIAQAWTGDGLVTVTTNLPHWKRHRKIINPVFNQHILDGYLGIFNYQSRLLVEELSEKVNTGPFDHADLLEESFLKIIFQTAMGCDENETSVLLDNNFKMATKSMFQIIVKRFFTIWMYSDFLYSFTALKKQQDESVAILHKTADTIIKQKRDTLQTSGRNSTKFSSLVDFLLELQPNEAFTDTEIKEEVLTFIEAGSDTSATIFTYALMLLGSHKDIQDKVYDEIKQVFGESTRDTERKDLTNLTYMEAMLLESIRLYPVLVAIPREVVEDVELSNCTLPAGTTCFVLVGAIHRDPKVWGSDAADFRPERWLTPGELPLNPGAYAGFSIGKRGCIGRTYAMMSIKTSMVHILRRYRISADISKLELQLDTIMKPSSGCHIALELR